jgi:hypothetical protein
MQLFVMNVCTLPNHIVNFPPSELLGGAGPFPLVTNVVMAIYGHYESV